jgi:hypothetical protein
MLHGQNMESLNITACGTYSSMGGGRGGRGGREKLTTGTQ